MTASVLAMVGELDGCALWRVLLPFTMLQRQGRTGIEWGMRDDMRLGDVAHQFDAIILPRLHWPPEERAKGDKWFEVLRRAGIATIYEIDDDLFTDDFVRRLTNLHGYTLEYAEERRECIMHTLTNCDGVTVSSQRLATIVSQHTDKPVKVVPNFIDLRWFRQVQRNAERKVPGLTIGWAGGNRPDSDVSMMAEAWARIAARYPKVTFVIQGHHAKAIYDAVPNERIAMLDWMPIDSYPAGMVNIDIGCCPLGDTQFNRAKTYIKAMEYAASGAPVVASPTVYNQLIEHGKDGYICQTVDEWEAALSELVENYDRRREMQRALLGKVRREHALERFAWRWTDAWDAIVADFRSRQSKPKILTPREVMYA